MSTLIDGRQAIQTKYHGPTNRIGSRISATCAAGRVYMEYLHNLNPAENHKQAAAKLATKLGWNTGTWAYGVLADGSGVHVNTY